MPDPDPPAATGAKPRHLFPRDPADDDEAAADFNPYSEEGDFRARRRGVGDDVADPGKVEPYGHVEDRNDFNLDTHIWVCGSCGYQTAAVEDPEGVCPNCSTQGEFIIQHM